MLPDLLVVVLKVRDYVLWFGPPYLGALALGAVLHVLWPVWAAGRLLPGGRAAPLLAAIVGGPAPPQSGAGPPSRAEIARALWRRSLACGLTPVTLLLPGYLNGLFLLVRAGGVLLVSGFMAGGVVAVGPRPCRGAVPGPAPQAGPEPPADSGAGTSRAAGLRGYLTLAWQYFRRAVDAELNRVLLGAALGGLIVAWAPGVWLGEQLSGATLGAALLGALLGFVLPLNGGAVLPVIAALITRGAGPAAVVALLVAAPLLNWWDLRPLARQYSWRCLLVYVSLGLVGVSLLGFALAQLPGSGRLSSY